MSHPRTAAPASGAAFLFLLLLSPAVCSAGVDGVWTQTPPPILDAPTAVYDPIRQSMLVFGGRISDTETFTNETWEFSLSGSPIWTLLETTGDKPSPRSGHALLYDSRRHRLLVFGGADSVTRNDFWVLDLETDPPTWEEALPTGPLPPRVTWCQAVYDSLNDQAVVFGGADSLDLTDGPLTYVDDLWALAVGNPTQWTEYPPTGVPVSPRAGAGVFYDKPRQRMVLLGGYDGAALEDAFTLSLDATPTWTQLLANGGTPPARALPTISYDAIQDRVLLFGGSALNELNDVWELDLAGNEWIAVFPTGGPPTPRRQAAGIFDVPNQRMVLFGGNSVALNGVPDPVWALSLGLSPEWTALGSNHPRARWEAASAVDTLRRVMWMHGGTGHGGAGGTQVRSDLWAVGLGGATDWYEPATTGTPLGQRTGHSAIYDAPRDRLIFYGGDDDVAKRNDVWALTLSGTPAWSLITPSGTPPEGRMYHSAVYDGVNERMVIFGGVAESGNKNDVWALSLAGTPAWTQLFPTGAPLPNLYAQAGGLDEAGNRLIIYGGLNGALSDSVYALSLTGSPAWERILPSGTPPPSRMFTSMTGIGSRLVVTGGNGAVGSSAPLNDTWLLSLYPPSWRALDVGPLLPRGRSAHLAGFDHTSYRLAVFSGQGATTSPDTWTLVLDQAVPALVSLVSANARAGRVELAWELSSPLESATVQRSTDGAVWADLSSVTQDGNGRLSYVDLDVVPGGRYGYRLALTDGTKSAAAWVEVPAAASFALRGMSPNPGPANAALVAFTLPDGSPARLEVMDIAGRQVFAREVGSLGPGQHFVRVSGEAPLAPGVYLVRLTRGGQALTAKAVTTR